MPSSPLRRPATLAALLAARWEAPGHHRLLRAAGVWNQPLWKQAPERTCRGRWHGYRLRLALNDYHQRGAFFFGRMMDLPVQVFLRQALQPGDHVLDIGANIGLTALLAAHRVGPGGLVAAFEPNPSVFQRLQAHTQDNNLAWIHNFNIALSDHESTMRLIVPPTGNTGAGTLGSLPPRHGGKTSAEYDVALKVGDSFVSSEPALAPFVSLSTDARRVTEDAPLAPYTPPRAGQLPKPALLIKIDVEGHETAALRGLSRTIASRLPAIILEVNPDMLSRNGSSTDELLGLLASHGYHFFNPVAHARPFRLGERLTLHPLAPDWRPTAVVNIAAIHPESQAWPRLKPRMTTGPLAAARTSAAQTSASASTQCARAESHDSIEV